MSAMEPSWSGGLSRKEEAIEGEIVGRPPMSRKVAKATTHAVGVQYGRGAVGVVRVETTARVTEYALLRLGDLEAEETRAIAQDPHNGGRRQRRLVDAAERVFEDAIRTTGQAYR